MKTVICHPYDWTVQDKSPTTNDESTEIRAWCLDRDSNSTLLRIQTYHPWMYVLLPSVIDRSPYSWSDMSAKSLFTQLGKILKQDAPIDAKFEWRPMLYYYQGNNVYPFLRLTFRNMDAMNHCVRLMVNKTNNTSKMLKIEGFGFMKFRVMEDQITIVRKMLTEVKLQYCQWMSVQGYHLPREKRISKLEHEYLIDWRSIKPLHHSETKLWVTHPKVLVYDIECNSKNINKFPTKDYSEDNVTVISALFFRPGIADSIKRYVYVLCDCKPIDGVEVKVFQKEMDLINAFAQLTAELDPDVVSGYNILGFDYQYLDARYILDNSEWPQITRLHGQTPFLKEPARPGGWRSSGSGINNFKPLQMEGRISIDLFPVIRRDYKLAKYGLGDVGKYFLGEGKHEISAKEMFLAYQNLQATTDQINSIDGSIYPKYPKAPGEDSKIPAEIAAQHEKNVLEMTRLVRYCVQDSELVIGLFNKLNIWIYLTQLSNIVGVTLTEIFTRGQQIRCLSLLYNASKELGYVIDKHEGLGIRIKGGAVKDPLVGYWKWIMCLDFSSLYPSIMISHNMCYTTLVPTQFDDKVKDDDCHVFDFIQEESKTNKGTDETIEEDDDDISEATEKKREESFQQVHRKYRFVKKEVRKGILPELLTSLIAERSAVKKEMFAAERYVEWYEQKVIKDHLDAKERHPEIEKRMHQLEIIDRNQTEDTEYQSLQKELKDCEKLLKEYADAIRPKTEEETQKYNEAKLLAVIMDKRQLALKIVCNSVYGFTGVPNNGLLPINEIAMCVTYRGRDSIKVVEDYLKKKYNATIVYGDTDSVMFDMGLKNGKECHHWGPIIAEETSKLFLKPMKLEYEKAMWIICIKKKKYIAALVDKDGNIDLRPEKIMFKGVLPARRDNTKLARRMYIKTALNRFHDVTCQETVDYYTDMVQELVTNKVDPQELAIVKGIGANYKQENYYINVFATRLRKQGKAVQPGERLDYLVVRGEGKVGERMRLPEDYMSGKEKLDYFYYLDQIRKPIDQLFGICYAKDLLWLNNNNLGYKPDGRYKFVSVDRIVEMLAKMYRDEINRNLKEIEDGKDVMNIEETMNFKFPEISRKIIRKAPDVTYIKYDNCVIEMPNITPPTFITTDILNINIDIKLPEIPIATTPIQQPVINLPVLSTMNLPTRPLPTTVPLEQSVKIRSPKNIPIMNIKLPNL